MTDSTGKCVTLKDIHNIRARSAKVGTDEWEATVQELEKFVQSDSGAVVEIVVNDDTNDFEILVIQSSEMRANLNKFPEVLQLDGTYGLNQCGLPLYALVVEDAHGCGHSQN